MDAQLNPASAAQKIRGINVYAELRLRVRTIPIQVVFKVQFSSLIHPSTIMDYLALKKKVLESTTREMYQTHLDAEAIIPADPFAQEIMIVIISFGCIFLYFMWYWWTTRTSKSKYEYQLFWAWFLTRKG